ncbi:NB-ARC domain protein [Treponema primitia ZAS-2]|uniref:NB-ARC domain protein n=1 Tax=Treponema primitia (strain ATCC BAA-887 / DSM 12427 / ZAS-2) TaxID=545694 RepID=F5YNI8_TREPZ|nr:caspase family protein [Treponema primitia]AEF85322.1 NB-ARC domain protein [Treponema primitia ZAS-2]
MRSLIRNLLSGAVLLALCFSCASSGGARALRAAKVPIEQTKLYPQLGHSFPVSSVVFSPDNTLIISGAADNLVKIWDIESGRELWTLSGHSSTVKSVAVSPEGKHIVSGSLDNTIIIWDTENGRALQTLTGHGAAVYSVAYSPDGRYIASGSADRTVRLWDAESGQELRTFTGHSFWVNAVSFSPDSRYLASCSRDNTIRIWDVQSGRLLRSLSGHSDEVDALCYSPDGKFIASGSHDMTIKVWNAENGREMRTLEGHSGVVKSIAYSPDGRYIVSGSSVDATIKIWDAGTGQELNTIESTGIESLSYSPDGQRFASGSHDNSISVWSAAGGVELQKLSSRSSWARALAYSPDGKFIAAGSADRTIRIWEAGYGRVVRFLTGHTASVRALAYSPDGKYIASGGADNSVRVWNAETGQELWTLTDHSSVVRAVAYSPDGRFILSGSADNTLKIWDTETGLALRTLSGHGAPVNTLAYSPDGLYIASGSEDASIKIWEAETGLELRTLRGHDSWIINLAYSSNGRYIISGSMDRTMKVWDLESGEATDTLEGYSGEQQSGMALSPNGRFIAATTGGDATGSGVDSRTIRIRDADSGKLRFELTGHTNEIYALAYSPDGRFIASTSLDGTTRIWDSVVGRELAQFIGFNDDEWISVTPDGYYNSSFKGDGYFNIRRSGQVYGLDRYRPAFFKPALVQSRLQGLSTRSSRGFRGPNINGVSAPPDILVGEYEAGKLPVQISSRYLPLKMVKVFQNGRLLGNDVLGSLEGTGFKPAPTGLTVTGNAKKLDFILPLTLEGGTNTIEIVALDGFTEGRHFVELEGPPEQPEAEEELPKLWVFSIGVSRYDDPRINHLGFAAFDAREVLNFFKAQEGKQFGKVNTLFLSTGELLSPTWNNITQGLGAFFREVGSRDTVILFLSGHGVSDKEGNYHFLPSDLRLTEGNIPFEGTLSCQDINAALDIPGRKLVFIDSSHTAGIRAGNIRNVDSIRLAREFQDNRPLIFNSGHGDELSYENAQYQLGLFTYALLQGLQGQADTRRDGQVTMAELDAYVTKTVSTLSGGRQNPSASGGYKDFVVAVTE